MSILCSRSFSHLQYTHQRTEAPDPASFERHCHNEFELLFVRHGAGKYVVEGREYPLAPQTLLFTRPFEFHYVCPSIDTPYERHVLNFDLSAPIEAAVLPILRQGTGSGLYYPPNRLPAKLCQILSDMDAALELFSGTRQEVQEYTMLRAELTQLLLHLSVVTPAEENAREEDMVARVTDYISAHLADTLTLDSIAKYAFVGKYYLCHTFRRQTGVSVGQYIRAKRIALAEQLLEDSTPATEVAGLVGYGTYSSFYRAFREQTGRPPVGRSYGNGE